MVVLHRNWVGTQLMVGGLVLALVAAACSSTRSGEVGQSAEPPITPRPSVPALPATTPDAPPAATATPPETLPLEDLSSTPTDVLTGAAVLVDKNFDQLQGLRVGLITHQPSVVDGRRLADLIHDAPNVELVALFAPEHGIEGTAAAGAAVDDAIDSATNIPIFSLYGSARSPTDGSLNGVDILVYDLQDVGSRFFTYTSTLGLSMQAAAQAGIPFVVLDRPNPLGSAIQGPTLETGKESFIGLYPIPSAYGLTSGELALLIQQQGWLGGLENLDLRIIKVANWQRDQVWPETELEWVAPSPNLPTAGAALIYPGTVLFEATSISEGRGTDEPFLTIGAPWIDSEALAIAMNRRALPGVSFEATTFAPRSIAQSAPNPRYLGQELFGVRIQVTDPAAVAGHSAGLHLLDAILRQGEALGMSANQVIDQPELFDRLAGSSQIRRDLVAARPVEEILESFVDDHNAFAELIADVLLYG